MTSVALLELLFENVWDAKPAFIPSNAELTDVARFNEELQAAAVPLTVMPGSEIQVVDTAEYRREFERGDRLSSCV